MVNNSVDCNQLFIVVNLIEDQIFLQDQDQIPLTFQDSIPRYCTGIKIISKRQNRFFQIVKFFKGSFTLAPRSCTPMPYQRMTDSPGRRLTISQVHSARMDCSTPVTPIRMPM